MKSSSSVSKFTIKEMCIIAVFAASCSAVEASLGTLMKSLGIPFTSAVLVGIDMLFYMVLRQTVKQRWAILAMAIVMAGSLMIYAGSIKGLTAVALLAQGIILQFFFWNKVSMTTIIPAVITIELYNVIHPFLRGILLGKDALELMITAAKKSMSAVGFESDAFFILIGVYYLARLIVALPVSFLTFSGSKVVISRLTAAGFVKKSGD